MLANGRAVRPSGRISYSKCHLLQLLEYLFRMFDLVYSLAFLNINSVSIKPFYVIVTNYDFIDLTEQHIYTVSPFRPRIKNSASSRVTVKTTPTSGTL